MSLIISRSSKTGDPDLVRIPFKEPGAQPTLRFSALSFQGVNNDTLTDLPSAEGGYLATPGTGDPSSYRVASSGVPGIRIQSTNDSKAPGAVRPTLYIPASSGRPVTASIFTVFRVFSYASTLVNESNLSRNDYLHFAGTYFGGNSTIFMHGLNDPSNPPGRVSATGGAGSSRCYGPTIAADGRLHTAAYVVDESAAMGTLYVDGVKAASAAAMPLSLNGLITGYAYSGGDFDVMEASTYSSVLSASAVVEKHKHYEALYQFQA